MSEVTLTREQIVLYDRYYNDPEGLSNNDFEIACDIFGSQRRCEVVRTIRTLAVERLDMDLEAAAKIIMTNTFGYEWEGLQNESIRDRGFEPRIYTSHSGLKWQGGKADMIEIAKAAIDAALSSLPKPKGT